MMKHLRYSVLAFTSVALACSGDARGQGQGGCPDVAALRNYRPPEATRVFAMDRSLIADLSPQRRIVVELKEVPKIVVDGYVAVEDRRFWEHNGVDLRSVGRALWRDITSLSFKEGFSTITMQLVRQVFPEELPLSQKVRRKACEVYLSGHMEKQFSKGAILRMYVNQVYLGGGLYGVEAASQGFFGKPVSKVTTAEAALLVGLVKNPEGYNPRKHMMRAIERRNTVLDVMVRERVLSAAEAERAKREPIRLAPPPEAAGPAPYFIAQVRRELRSRFGENADIEGFRVFTGLDPDLQRSARAALVEGLEKIENGAFGKYRWQKRVPGAPGDSTAAGTPYLQGLVVALDPHNGYIRALVGGRDFLQSQYDRAFQARRQPGSAFKPIVYAAAISRGLTLNAHIESTPVSVANSGSPAWQPDDHVPDSVQAVTVRDAMVLSSNNAGVRIGQYAGVETVIQTARALGITTRIPPYPSIFLGAAEVIPVEFVAAYAAFANGGKRVKPTLIIRVEDARGKVLWRANNPPMRAIDEGVAFLTLSMMEDVVDRGTATRVRSAGFWLPAAGKTGTTNGSKDNWFVGMTPDVVAGVWVGFDKPKTVVNGAEGGKLAAPIWGNMMREAYKEKPAPGAWAPPPSVSSVPIDPESGLLATSGCPAEQIRVEYFLPGTEPHDYCPIHGGSGVERTFEKLWQGLKRVF
jgi:penicillin-binding protein 1A